MHWTLVCETRVVETDDPVNYRWVDGKLIRLDGEVIDDPYNPEALEAPDAAQLSFC
jgi:hypothetical protein